MANKRFNYPVEELLPSQEVIEMVMGYKTGEAPEPVSVTLREVMDDVSRFEDARAEYRILCNVKYDTEERSLTVEGVKFNLKSIIFSQIRKSTEVALFICTAGRTIGEKSRYYMKGDDLLRGYLYDVVGSEIAEAAADRLQKELERSQSQSGKHITNRFSPGYCGWNVSEQHKLFSFFPDNYCAITLTDSALMNPVKSVSGIIGIGSDVRLKPYQCKVCDDENCIYRGKKSKV
jgi:hypothetical protein